MVLSCFLKLPVQKRELRTNVKLIIFFLGDTYVQLHFAFFLF